MQAYPNMYGSVSPVYRLICCSAFILLLLCNTCAAAVIVIKDNQIIEKPTEYKNVTIDMIGGRFTVNKGGSLEIENSIINTTISPENPYFAFLNSGRLILKNNTINVTVSDISPDPQTKSLYQLINIQAGSLNIEGNTFINDIAYTVGFLETKKMITNGFIINNNSVKNFHGGIYLNKSNDATINDNTFENVSLANIFNKGNFNNYKGNSFVFPGNLAMGNAFEIVNSKGLEISDNFISSSANYGIYILGCQNIFIENNKIADSLSYAIYIEAPSEVSIAYKKYIFNLLVSPNDELIDNSNITIKNNYLSQNKYGLSGGFVDHLTVADNIFIQRFANNKTRQYWTDNDILIPMTTNMIWTDNLYKEAFTQEVPGDNSNSLKFVSFPQHGGVFLP